MAMASCIEGRWHDAASLEHVTSYGLYSPVQSLSTLRASSQVFPGNWTACSTACKVSRQDTGFPSQPTAQQQVHTCEASLGGQC